MSFNSFNDDGPEFCFIRAVDGFIYKLIVVSDFINVTLISHLVFANEDLHLTSNHKCLWLFSSHEIPSISIPFRTTTKGLTNFSSIAI